MDKIKLTGIQYGREMNCAVLLTEASSEKYLQAKE